MDHLAGRVLQEESQKSSLAFRTISEVSQEIDVPQHVLRFWESRFSQIKPLKRGGGRRYYRPEDIQLLISIKNYLYKQGYTIKGVQRLLKEGRSESTPSFAAYRRDMADDVAQEIPPEDFDEAFGENAAEAAAQPEPAPAPADPVERGLNAVSQIHDQIENPTQPMRVEAQAEAGKIPAKLTPAMQTELTGILDELKTLREMLRGGSN